MSLEKSSSFAVYKKSVVKKRLTFLSKWWLIPVDTHQRSIDT